MFCLVNQMADEKFSILFENGRLRVALPTMVALTSQHMCTCSILISHTLLLTVPFPSLYYSGSLFRFNINNVRETIVASHIRVDEMSLTGLHCCRKPFEDTNSGLHIKVASTTTIKQTYLHPSSYLLSLYPWAYSCHQSILSPSTTTNLQIITQRRK